jgi:hypothetical protein
VIASQEANVEDLAHKAGADAMTVTPVGPAFADAILRKRPLRSAPSVPRPSLLPDDYRREAVIEQFSDLLDRVTI